ncbi:MAG: biotin/lipoyl-binding protein, partial [Candidatus Diapherotrites archaeon]|nr:biotin/lipoyl-binding protein [Candidatus Diapherotrites archaeon]
MNAPVRMIRKRTGESVSFNPDKISNAIRKAFIATESPFSESSLEALTGEVVELAESRFVSGVPSVEEIQDSVEAVLMKNNHVRVAKAYILYRARRQESRAASHMQAILSVPVSFNATGVISKIYVKDGEQVKKGQLIAALDSRGDMAQLQSYQANLALQKANYQRMLSIRNSGAISQQMLDSQKALWQQAVAQVNQQQLFIEQKSFYAPF